MIEQHLDASATQPRPHRCQPPPVSFTSVAGHPTGDPVNSRWRPDVTILPAGTRFYCRACGTVWVVNFIPAYRGPTIGVAARWDWAEETRRQRRRRLRHERRAARR